MKISPALRIPVLWLAATVVGATLTISPAAAAEPAAPPSVVAPAPADDDAPVERPAVGVTLGRSASASLSVDLTPEPSVSLSGTLALDDDDVDPTPLSTSQCGAGYFCVWSSSNYTGSLQRFKTQSQFSSVYLSRVGSFFNNRPDRVFIYQYGGGSTSACYAPRAKRSTTSGWLSYADSVYLSTATNC